MPDVDENEQVRFWRGEFGDAYIERNTGDERHLHDRALLWAEILKTMAEAPPLSILEVGSNIGENLRALKRLTHADLIALEPNARARAILARDKVTDESRILEGPAHRIPLPADSVDFAFTSGVLIHIHPDHLLFSCQEIHRVAGRYIGCIEYFSDQPEEKIYRGHEGKLFKRDFGSFWLDHFPGLRVLGYGFAWKRLTGWDNATWWVFEKRHG
jgi:spore coat polysaccharide biosynthesis protein SpsF